MKFIIKKEQLERLKEACDKNEKGLSNFILIENKDKEDHYVFRVVCEKIVCKHKRRMAITNNKDVRCIKCGLKLAEQNKGEQK